MARWWFGFSVIEQMVALLMVAMTALLLIRSNTTNSIIFQTLRGGPVQFDWHRNFLHGFDVVGIWGSVCRSSKP